VKEGEKENLYVPLSQAFDNSQNLANSICLNQNISFQYEPSVRVVNLRVHSPPITPTEALLLEGNGLCYAFPGSRFTFAFLYPACQQNLVNRRNSHLMRTGLPRFRFV